MNKGRNAKKKVTKDTKRAVPTVWGYDGCIISRSSRQTTIPLKRPKSPGYSVRRGYTYTVQRPDGTRIQRRAYSREEAEQLADTDMVGSRREWSACSEGRSRRT